MGRLPPSIAGLLVEIDHGVQDRNLNARRTRRGRQSSNAASARLPRAGALGFSSQALDVPFSMARCSGSSGPVEHDRVRQRGHAGVGSGRPSEALAGFCGMLPAGLVLCERGDPRAKGRRRAPAGLLREQFRAGALVRQPALLPGRARPPVRRAREREVSPHAAVSSGRPPRRGQPGRAVKAAYRGANPPPGLITGLTPHGDHPIDEVGVEQQAALSSAPLRCPGRSGSLPELGSPTAPVWLFAPCR
jgi:hypothetical protein